MDQSIIDSDSKWVALFADWEHEVFGCAAAEIKDIRKIWRKITESIQNFRQIESLKSTIATSAIFHESGTFLNTSTNTQYSNKSSSIDSLLSVIQISAHSQCNNVPKSASLSQIMGKKYKRNMVAAHRHKSISNEFMNIASNFMPNEWNNNDDKKFGNNHEQQPNPNQTANSINSINSNTDDLFSSSTNQNQLPYFGITKFDNNDFRLVRDYLTKAFKNQYHPLGILSSKISYCFYTSYGCWKVKPISILSTLAMQEWESIVKRIYDIVRMMFPKLPEEYCSLDE